MRFQQENQAVSTPKKKGHQMVFHRRCNAQFRLTSHNENFTKFLIETKALLSIEVFFFVRLGEVLELKGALTSQLLSP